MSNYGVIGVVAIPVLVGLYLLPGIVASARGHHNRLAIWALTVLLGWTALGWIGALIWSLTAPQKTAH